MTMYLTMRFAGPCCAAAPPHEGKRCQSGKAVAVYHNPQYQDETVFIYLPIHTMF